MTSPVRPHELRPHPTPTKLRRDFDARRRPRPHSTTPHAQPIVVQIVAYIARNPPLKQIAATGSSRVRLPPPELGSRSQKGLGCPPIIDWFFSKHLLQGHHLLQQPRHVHCSGLSEESRPLGYMASVTTHQRLDIESTCLTGKLPSLRRCARACSQVSRASFHAPSSP